MGERKEKKKREKNASSHTKKSKATHLILGQLKPHIRTCLQSNPTFSARESLTAEAAPQIAGMAEVDGSKSTGLALLKAHPSASLGSGLTPSTALKAGRLKRNRLSLTGQPRKSRGPAGRDVSSSSHGLLGETRADTGQRTLAGAFAIDASGESLAGPPSVTDAAMPSAGQSLSTERCTQGDCSTPSLDGMQQALSAA